MGGRWVYCIGYVFAFGGLNLWNDLLCFVFTFVLIVVCLLILFDCFC